MSVAEAAPVDRTGISRTTGVIAETVNLPVKTRKALTLEEPGNAHFDLIEETLFSGLSVYADEQSRLELAVRESVPARAGDIVYQSRDRQDSLTRLLCRDEIGWLVFQPLIGWECAALPANELYALLFYCRLSGRCAGTCV